MCNSVLQIWYSMSWLFFSKIIFHLRGLFLQNFSLITAFVVGKAKINTCILKTFSSIFIRLLLTIFSFLFSFPKISYQKWSLCLWLELDQSEYVGCWGTDEAAHPAIVPSILLCRNIYSFTRLFLTVLFPLSSFVWILEISP